MKKIIDWLRAEFAEWGQRLNYLQATIVAYLVVQPNALREAVSAIVPVAYRPIAAAIAAFASFLIVRAAAKRDAQQAVINGRR